MTNETHPDPRPAHIGLREWLSSLTALRRLLGDAGRTDDVFRILRTLNVAATRRSYQRLLRTGEGGRIAFEHRELRPLLADPAYLRRFAPGSLGASYVRFLDDTGYSADGLAEISRRDDAVREAPHPWSWFARRQRDTHDLWHILTGYRADDPVGEACLVGFTYAQVGGAGWRMILLGAMAKSLAMPEGWRAVVAMAEGYLHGRKASWLPGEDYERLLAEPLERARGRLGIRPPRSYEAIHRRLDARDASVASDGRIVRRASPAN